MNTDKSDSAQVSGEALTAREAQLDRRVAFLRGDAAQLREFIHASEDLGDSWLELNRVKVELLEALEAAYTRFGDFRFEWPGRSTPEGQQLLSQMRDAISKATGRDGCEVQDDYGTRVARTEREAAA